MKRLRTWFIGICILGFACAAQAASVKNVIWVIGDGMGPEILGFWMQGARYANLTDVPSVSYTEQLMNQGVWGLFFNNTYDTVVTDSAAAATQMATGKWSRPLFIGIDYNKTPAPTLLEVAREHGKAVGIVSDTYVTDATPAAFTAHTDTRRQKYEIAQQQIEFAPQVILGGGLRYFTEKENKGLLRKARQKGYRVVQNKKQLGKLTSGKVLGLFADQAMPMNVEMYQHPTVPTLTEMAQKAITLLEQNKDGFVLMVEAGKIDWAAHGNDPGSLWAEMRSFDKLIQYVTQYVAEHPDTLLYINADHDTGLGGFMYQHLDKKQAAQKTAQGEVLYDKNTDYASFNTYHSFEKQKRCLYYVCEEIKALPQEKRTRQEVQRRFSEALAEPTDLSQVNDVENTEEVLHTLNTQRGVSYATATHSSAPLISIAYGPGAENFAGVYHNTDIFHRMMKALNWVGK